MAAHIVYLILESKQKNDLFRSPMSENAQNILDLGTDNGDWCRIVVDKFPSDMFHSIVHVGDRRSDKYP